MKVLVPIKRVVDAYVKIRVDDSTSTIPTQSLKKSVNPFCEIAVEEAIRLKEQGKVEEIIAICVGETAAQEQLRSALALGADRAILIETTDVLSPISIAKILKEVATQEQVDLILLGKQSIDGDNNQTGQMLSTLLNWPQATFASKIDLKETQATVTREVDGGLQTLQLGLPAVITTDLRLNEPRYASLPNIMKAKRKPLDIKQLDDFSVELREHHRVIKIEAPAQRQAGEMVDSVETLVNKLIHEAKVTL